MLDSDRRHKKLGWERWWHWRTSTVRSLCARNTSKEGRCAVNMIEIWKKCCFFFWAMSRASRGQIRQTARLLSALTIKLRPPNRSYVREHMKDIPLKNINGMGKTCCYFRGQCSMQNWCRHSKSLDRWRYSLWNTMLLSCYYVQETQVQDVW